MNRLIIVAVLWLASFAACGQILPGILAGASSAPIVQNISTVQEFGTVVVGTSGTISYSYGSAPTAGNKLVCYAHDRNGPARTISLNDNMTDGGAWSATVSIGTNNMFDYIYEKTVGAVANVNKTITATMSSTYASAALVCKEIAGTGGSVWSSDGTAQTGNNTTGQPSTSGIGNAGTKDYCLGVTATVQGTPAPTLPLVTRASNFSDRALNIADGLGGVLVTPTWSGVSPGTGAWNALGACWKFS